jgi:hypothetical protein
VTVFPTTCDVDEIWGFASRVVSTRALCCLAYPYSECYAFPESLVYAVTPDAMHS